MLGCSRNTRKDIEIMGQIKVQKNVGGIEGLCIIEPTVHGDNRGYFMETYNSKDMQEAGIDRVFVQDNQSCSTKGVLRGLHFQKEYPQAKLVRAVKGSVFDVAVDIRQVVRSRAHRGEQEAVPYPGRLCTRIFSTLRCSRVLLQGNRFLAPWR